MLGQPAAANARRQHSNSLAIVRLRSPSDLTSSSPLSHPRANSEPQISMRYGAPQQSDASSRLASLQLNDLRAEKSTSPILKSDSISLSILEDTEDLIDSLEAVESFEVPTVLLKQGMLVLKVSHKSKKRICLKVDPVNFKIMFNQVSKTKVYEFLVDDIRSICAKEEANHYREEYGISKEFEKRWLTVVYFNQSKGKLKTLNLITDTSHDLKKLLFVIENFKKIKDEISKNFLVNLKDLDDNSKNIVFGKAEPTEKNIKKLLTFADVLKFCKRLNINLNPHHLKRLFVNVHTENTEGIDFDQFKSFVRMLKQRTDLDEIWKSVLNGKDYMTMDDFKNFSVNHQKESFDDDYMNKVFKKFTCNDSIVWTKENWSSYLQSRYSSYLKSDVLEEDYFAHPLNEYYILSSHNTYLIGRQVAGDSSVEGYIKALRRGCRCIEIDIWDNETEDGDPVVNHGRTFTSGISLINVLKTIKKYAFSSSPYPVILSLEVHCSAPFQIKIINALKSTFGAMLVDQTICFEGNLPSPEELKNRILVKVKKTSPTSNFGVDDNGNFVSSSTTGTSFSESNDTSSTSRKSSLKIRKRTSFKVIDALSDLGVYVQGVKFRNFSLPESKTFNHCFSLSEKAINSMLKDEMKLSAVDKHNRKYLMRVYPSKFRLKSSNFIPINYWAHGCQMVATNWQTYDLGQQLNESLFEKAEGSGFIRKPLALRRPLMKSTLRKVFVNRRFKTNFSVSVISGQNLPKPLQSTAINPFVVLEVIGTLEVLWDSSSTMGSTRLVAENGFNPIWNQTYSGSFESDNEMVFLRFSIHSSASAKTIEDSKEIGILVLNLFDIKQGYRYFPIKDSCGEQLLYSTLFLRVEYACC